MEFMSKMSSLGAEWSLVPNLNEVFITKAAAFRGIVSALKTRGIFDKVLLQVPEEVRGYMVSPPMAISKMPAVVFQYVLRGIGAVGGVEMVRAVAVDSLLSGMLKTMQPLVEGMLRLFGAEPGAFYRKLPQIMENQLTGITFSTQEPGPGIAEITITYEYLRNVPLECFVYWEGLFSVTWRICSVVGQATTELLADAHHNKGRVLISWQR